MRVRKIVDLYESDGGRSDDVKILCCERCAVVIGDLVCLVECVRVVINLVELGSL